MLEKTFEQVINDTTHYCDCATLGHMRGFDRLPDIKEHIEYNADRMIRYVLKVNPV